LKREVFSTLLGVSGGVAYFYAEVELLADQKLGPIDGQYFHLGADRLLLRH
jgi:hypothetical protein